MATVFMSKIFLLNKTCNSPMSLFRYKDVKIRGLVLAFKMKFEDN